MERTTLSATNAEQDSEQGDTLILITQKNGLSGVQTAEQICEVNRMNDLISRQDAIEVTWEEPTNTDTLNVLTEVRDKIRALPSAQPEQRWIPCSNGLPSDSGDYLVWLQDESEHYAVIPFDADAEDFGWWQDYYHPVSFGFLDSKFIKAENVTAWQSLPKPYREDGGGE